MPKFLEDKLRAQAAKKGLSGRRAAGYVYGAMNNMGAMHGNQETAKVRAMQRKHDKDKAATRISTSGASRIRNEVRRRFSR